MDASPGLAEHEVQQALSGLHVDTLIAFYLYEVERRCLQNGELCRYVYDKMKWVQSYDVMCAIWQESQRDLDELPLGLLGRHVLTDRHGFASWWVPS